jgi:predicted AlkP superfamily phosphohydrolase/phosphomutase
MISIDRIGTIGALLFVVSSVGGCQQQTPIRQTPQKLIILGFDGADPQLVKQWMDTGKLPNIRKLTSTGTFQPLGTTNPPESPVAWATFATGMNPGGHGIFDFIRRNPENYLPEIALATPVPPRFLFGWLPIRGASMVNNRHGVPFYKTLADAGIKTTVLRMPLEFPPAELPHGKVLGGLNIPDIRGTWGTFFYFSTDLTRWETGNAEYGGKLVRIEVKDNSAETEVEGPVNPAVQGLTRVRLPLKFSLDREKDEVKIMLQGQEETVAEGHWSHWFHFTFKVNSFLKLHGVGRFHVLQTFPEMSIYLTPISFDPSQPPYPISSPSDYAAQLEKACGTFKTLGWAHDTWALNEERIDEKVFLEDVFETFQQHAKLLSHELTSDRASCTVAVFTATDSVSHMFYRLLDPSHPRYDARLAEQYGNAILETYRKMDEVIGRVMGSIDSRDVLVVVSDHGFHSWRKGFNTNTWLVENGFMKLKGSANQRTEDLFSEESFFPNVDWEKTQAYSVGLGQIYVNLKGREKRGILYRTSKEYEDLLDRMIAGLESYADPDTGEKVIQKVYRDREIFHGEYTREAADLQLAFRPGYRTSWQTTLGAVPAGVVVANLKKWSGDHCASEPADTPGILLCNRKLSSGDIALMDIAPSALKYFDVPIPPQMDGKAVPLR